jgi:hypothetical protein
VTTGAERTYKEHDAPNPRRVLCAHVLRRPHGLRERPPDSRPHDARFGAFGEPVVAGELAGVSAVLEALVLGAPE